MLSRASLSGLRVVEFDVENEVNLDAFTVYARLIVDPKSVRHARARRLHRLCYGGNTRFPGWLPAWAIPVLYNETRQRKSSHELDPLTQSGRSSFIRLDDPSRLNRVAGGFDVSRLRIGYWLDRRYMPASLAVADNDGVTFRLDLPVNSRPDLWVFSREFSITDEKGTALRILGAPASRSLHRPRRLHCPFSS